MPNTYCLAFFRFAQYAFIRRPIAAFSAALHWCCFRLGFALGAAAFFPDFLFRFAQDAFTLFDMASRAAALHGRRFRLTCCLALG